ncbi:hypothetical protein CLV90_1940 [Maribacter spongiicola]|uniref:Uncharacterized protein n=1 Tax=Maribacter spongiicola TaxID=1206753 RepID=A0A4R7K1Y8_9FLAO|nr:hypothetical protein CLV90_1940 [Maribacter spongiicola]
MTLSYALLYGIYYDQENILRLKNLKIKLTRI